MAKLPRTYRLDEGLLARFEAEAKRRGQSYTVFVSRALEAALGRGLSTGEAAADEPVPASPRTSALPPDARKAEDRYFAPERKSASYVKPFNPIPKGGKG